MSEELVQDVAQAETAPAEELSKESVPPSEETPTTEEEKPKAEVEEGKKFSQKDMDEAIQKRLARESRKLERQIRAEFENKVLREQLASQQPRQVEQPSGEPKPEQFRTYEEYIDKLTDWKLEQKLEKQREQYEAQSRQQAQETYEDTLRSNLMKSADKYDDFEEVVESIPVQYVTDTMTAAIGESDAASEIAYYLGNNHKEAAAIARMSPVAQVRAISQLEAKLKAPAEVSKAPPPADTVGKGRAKAEPDLSKLSLDDYIAQRKKQGARWAR